MMPLPNYQANSNTLSDDKSAPQGDGFTFSFSRYTISQENYTQLTLEAQQRNLSHITNVTQSNLTTKVNQDESVNEKLDLVKNIYSLSGSEALLDADAKHLVEGQPGHVTYEPNSLETDENLKRYYTVHRHANPDPRSRCAHIFKCDICIKSTTQFVNMKAHLRTHLGILPYKCSICKKGFTTSSNCKLHLKTKSCIKAIKLAKSLS